MNALALLQLVKKWNPSIEEKKKKPSPLHFFLIQLS